MKIRLKGGGDLNQRARVWIPLGAFMILLGQFPTKDETKNEAKRDWK